MFARGNVDTSLSTASSRGCRETCAELPQRDPAALPLVPQGEGRVGPGTAPDASSEASQHVARMLGRGISPPCGGAGIRAVAVFAQRAVTRRGDGHCYPIYISIIVKHDLS
jgi:hypothetical protein